jgi:hypothetical protein
MALKFELEIHLASIHVSAKLTPIVIDLKDTPFQLTSRYIEIQSHGPSSTFLPDYDTWEEIDKVRSASNAFKMRYFAKRLINSPCRSGNSRWKDNSTH